jgi:hypothetical protein
MSGLAIPVNREKQNVTMGAGSVALCVLTILGEQTIYLKKKKNCRYCGWLLFFR